VARILSKLGLRGRAEAAALAVLAARDAHDAEGAQRESAADR
jgi:hypothetical protein